MSTFIGPTVRVRGHLVWRFIVPLVGRLMSARRDTVRQQLADAAAARPWQRRSQAHRRWKTPSRKRTVFVEEEARTDAERIAEQLEGRPTSRPDAHQKYRLPVRSTSSGTADPSLASNSATNRCARRGWYAIAWRRAQQSATVDPSRISSMRWRRLRPSITAGQECAQPAGGALTSLVVGSAFSAPGPRPSGLFFAGELVSAQVLDHLKAVVTAISCRPSATLGIADQAAGVRQVGAPTLRCCTLAASKRWCSQFKFDRCDLTRYARQRWLELARQYGQVDG